MKITEQQFLDYMYCPAKYNMKYVQGMDMPEEKSLPKLLEQISKYFYITVLSKSTCSLSNMKSRWDNICVHNMDYINQKRAIDGYGMIINMARWLDESKFRLVDFDTKYDVVINGLEIVGYLPALALTQNNGVELFYMNFSNRMPRKEMIDKKILYTLHTCAFEKAMNHACAGIHVHHVKTDDDIKSIRTNADYMHLSTVVNGVKTGLENNAFFTSETVMCESCGANMFCQYWH